MVFLDNPTKAKPDLRNECQKKGGVIWIDIIVLIILTLDLVAQLH